MVNICLVDASAALAGVRVFHYWETRTACSSMLLALLSYTMP
jgi:hypothetical protein